MLLNIKIGGKDDSFNTKRALSLLRDVLQLTSDGLIVIKSHYNNSSESVDNSTRPLLIYDTVFAAAADHITLAGHRNKIIHLFALQGLLAIVLWSESKAGQLTVNLGMIMEYSDYDI